MVGVIQADTLMHDRPQGRGYAQLALTGLSPWYIKHSAATIAAHEFHYSRLQNLSSEYKFAYHVKRGHGIDGQHDGIIYKNLVAAYIHLRETKQSQWTKSFVDFVRNAVPKSASS